MNAADITRDFKGIWIPKELWLHPTLTIIQKALIAEIDSLDDGTGCYASNEYLAQMFGVTEAGMANLISKVRKLGVIEDVSFNGRERRIRVNPVIKADLTKLGEGRLNHPVKSYRDRNKKRENTLDLLGERAQGTGTEIPFRNLFPASIFLPLTVDQQAELMTAWDDFIADRKERRKPVTSRAAKMLLTKLAERPQHATIALKAMIEHGWSGLQWFWLEGKNLIGGNRGEARPGTLSPVSPAIRPTRMLSISEQQSRQRERK